VVLAVIHVAAIVFTFFNPNNTKHIQYVTQIGVNMFNRVCALLNHVFLLSYRSTMIAATASIVALDDEWRPAGSGRLATFVNVEVRPRN